VGLVEPLNSADYAACELALFLVISPKDKHIASVAAF